MAQRWWKAQDTFVAMLGDGSQRFVSKGETLPDSHELVKRDQAGSKTLFRALDTGEDEAPAKSEPKAEALAPPPVKAEAKPAARGKAS